MLSATCTSGYLIARWAAQLQGVDMDIALAASSRKIGLLDLLDMSGIHPLGTHPVQRCKVFFTRRLLFGALQSWPLFGVFVRFVAHFVFLHMITGGDFFACGCCCTPRVSNLYLSLFLTHPNTQGAVCASMYTMFKEGYILAMLARILRAVRCSHARMPATPANPAACRCPTPTYAPVVARISDPLRSPRVSPDTWAAG